MSGLQRNGTIKHWMCEHICQQGRGDELETNVLFQETKS